MPVNHRGHMSKHPAWVKIAILEFLEARLKDAAVDLNIGEENVHVYDPFTTEMDFHIFVNASWSDYLRLYSWYYNLENKGERQKALESDLLTKYGVKYSTSISRAIYDVGPDDPDREIFNASTSETMILYNILQMKSILQFGHP